MAKNLDTTADATGATACECSKFEAFISEQLTEENLASGNYDSFSTGCAATTKREFAPGHDAKLKSFLIQHGAQGHEIRYGGTLVTTAEDMAKRYTFGYMILEGIDKAKAKLAAKAERAAKKGKTAERKLAEGAGVVKLADVVKAEEAAHAEAEARKVAEREQTADWGDVKDIAEVEADLDTKAREERERDLVQAKIGRWTYEGRVGEDGVFVYRTPKGELKQAAEGKYKLV